MLAGYVDKSVVQVVSGNNWGSGIILDKQKGVIITNAHVVVSCKYIYFLYLLSSAALLSCSLL